jgi:hypothetical protein
MEGKIKIIIIINIIIIIIDPLNLENSFLKTFCGFSWKLAFIKGTILRELGSFCPVQYTCFGLGLNKKRWLFYIVEIVNPVNKKLSLDAQS